MGDFSAHIFDTRSIIVSFLSFDVAGIGLVYTDHFLNLEFQDFSLHINTIINIHHHFV